MVKFSIELASFSTSFYLLQTWGTWGLCGI